MAVLVYQKLYEQMEELPVVDITTLGEDVTSLVERCVVSVFPRTCTSWAAYPLNHSVHHVQQKAKDGPLHERSVIGTKLKKRRGRGWDFFR